MNINKDFPGNAVRNCLMRLYKRDKRILKQTGFKTIESIKEIKI